MDRPQTSACGQPSELPGGRCDKSRDSTFFKATYWSCTQETGLFWRKCLWGTLTTGCFSLRCFISCFVHYNWKDPSYGQFSQKSLVCNTWNQHFISSENVSSFSKLLLGEGLGVGLQKITSMSWNMLNSCYFSEFQPPTEESCFHFSPSITEYLKIALTVF